MAVTRRRLQAADSVDWRPLTTPQRVDGDSPAHPSPARTLQIDLAALISAPSLECDRSPGAVRCAFILGGSLLSWAGLIASAKVLISLTQS